MKSSTLPEIDSLWDFDRPEQTEAKFREWLEVAAAADDAIAADELRTQIARTFSLHRRFEEAHAILDTLVEPVGRVRIRYLLERGRTFNSSGSQDLARPLFVEAWKLGREFGEDALAVDAAHMVAIVESGEEALRWNETALELALRSEVPRARRWRKSLHNNIGWTYFEMGQTELALDHFRKTQACAIENDDPQAESIARWSIAKALRVLGQIEAARAMQEKLLSESEADGNDPGYQCEEMGECLLALDQAEAAKPFFARAFASLSQDAWLQSREPERLARLEALSK